MKRFGVMLDMSRNAVMKPEEVKNFATIIKGFGYNMIQLYTEDTYEVENEPYFGYLRGRYTTEELTDIVNYCESIGVEVIPCIQTLAHLNQIFKWQPYKCVKDTDDILLAENERTYELIENMFRTLRKSFKSEYIHIGMDEAHMLGLGKYLEKHGYNNRFEILSRHLQVVIDISKKYGFKPIMWSDMFFRLGNGGLYASKTPVITQEVVDITPKEVGLVYWDYYSYDKELYDAMFAAHNKFDNEIWFAGGAWTWAGLSCGNKKTIDTMVPALLSAKEQNIENIFMTMWGDNGKECSFYSVLPSLFAIKKIYDGENDMEKIKSEFTELTGEDYDAMFDLDLVNFVGGNDDGHNGIAKTMLYNDPLLGFFDSGVREGGSAEYAKYAKILSDHAKTSKTYGYIFEANAALCDVLALKYDLGARARKAYGANDKEALARVCADCGEIARRLEVLHEKLSVLWHRENKPHGFEVQDLRLGGLMLRMRSCEKRLSAYLNGEIDSIPELEDKILDWFGGGEKFDETSYPRRNSWTYIASPSVI